MFFPYGLHPFSQLVFSLLSPSLSPSPRSLSVPLARPQQGDPHTVAGVRLAQAEEKQCCRVKQCCRGENGLLRWSVDALVLTQGFSRPRFSPPLFLLRYPFSSLGLLGFSLMVLYARAGRGLLLLPLCFFSSFYFYYPALLRVETFLLLALIFLRPCFVH